MFCCLGELFYCLSFLFFNAVVAFLTSMTSFCSLNIFCLFHLYFSTVSLYVFHAFINFLISQRALMVSTFEVSVLLTRIECLHIHVEMKYREISVSRGCLGQVPILKQLLSSLLVSESLYPCEGFKEIFGRIKRGREKINCFSRRPDSRGLQLNARTEGVGEV